MITSTEAAPLRRARQQGFTLVEVMVAAGIASIVTLALLTSYSMTTRGFVAAGNYSDMERDARVTMDNISRDIRQATGLVAFASNDITIAVATEFSDSGAVTNSKNVRYYKGTGNNSNYLYRVDSGLTSAVAKSVSAMRFIAYDRNMITNGITPADTKLLQVDLTLRKYTIDNPNTEQILSARVVLRNKLLP
jgi:prepilin-type N-terminal cleavage/methylation domain-containing protein